MLFRVWCENNREWETDNCSIDAYGNILCGWTKVKPETHKVEFNTGVTLADGTETFFGDIVRITDTNWGYGGEYDRTHDGYWYTVITKDNFCDLIIYWSGEGSVWCSDMECVGNIHETELTDAMKVWIKE